MSDLTIYIVGDDNLPISTDIQTVAWYEDKFNMEIPYFLSYTECMNYIFKK